MSRIADWLALKTFIPRVATTLKRDLHQFPWLLTDVAPTRPFTARDTSVHHIQTQAPTGYLSLIAGDAWCVWMQSWRSETRFRPHTFHPGPAILWLWLSYHAHVQSQLHCISVGRKHDFDIFPVLCYCMGLLVSLGITVLFRLNLWMLVSTLIPSFVRLVGFI